MSFATKLASVDIRVIQPNPEQPRRHFEPEALAELAASIRERGILQPLLLEETDGGSYILHAGERRLRAAKMVGLTMVPAQVLPPLNGTGKQERLVNAFIENAVRADLTPIDEAQAIYALRQLGLSNNEISRRTGININTLAGRLLLLDLEPTLQQLVADGRLPRDPRVVKALLSIGDSGSRIKLGSRLARPGVTIGAIVAACERFNERIAQQQAVAHESVPALALSEAGRRGMTPVKWPNVRAAAQATCEACDVKRSLNHIPEPAWSVVMDAARCVCDSCSLRANAQLDICRECPSVDLLRRLVANG